MFKMRVALLGVLALFVASGIAASAASAAGPFWHVNGAKLVQGSKQVKLQIKGPAALSAKFGGAEIQVECKNSISESATIDGEGSVRQGQGTGRVTYTQCIVVKPAPNCTVAEPIKTAQVKSHLVYITGNSQQKFGMLFEPQVGKTFVELKFSGSGCGVIIGTQPVSGTVVAEVSPTEKEGQEGLLSFPTTPISEVVHEQQVVKPKLFLGSETAIFSGAYGARLDSGEKWGVFGQ